MFRRSIAPLLVAVVALAACGKDLSAYKTQVLGLVTKYKPQVTSALQNVDGLLAKAKELPVEIPGVSDIVNKLSAQKGSLDQLQGLIDGLPGQAEGLIKGGKEADLKQLVATVDTQVGEGVKAAETAVTEGKTGLEAAEGAAKKAAMEGAVKALNDKLGVPLTAALDKLTPLAAKVRALPPETAGAADLVKTVEGLEAAGAEAKKALEGAGPQILAAADQAAGQAIVDATTTTVDTATKKLEADIAALAAKVGGEAPADPAAAFSKTLSTGVVVNGNGQGIEGQLIAFIEDAAKPVDKTTWFNFDRLSFASGSTDLDMEASKAQLDNIVAILAAYPNAKIKVGGYTDNDGPAAANTKISQKRAEAVVKALTDAGVAADRLEAEGYGPEHPVCEANDTPECKAQNRRIAVRVTAK